MLEFTTAPQTDDDAPAAPAYPPFQCLFDGYELVGSVRPKSAIIAQLAPVRNRRTDDGMKIKLALDFIGDALDEPSRAYLERRLLDPTDRCDVEHVMPVLTAIADHWKAVADKEQPNRAARRGR